MIVSGFALISPDQQEIAWWEHIPGRINIPEIGAVIFAAEAGWSQYGYEIVSADREFADPAPVRRLIPKWKVLVLSPAPQIRSSRCSDCRCGPLRLSQRPT